VFLPALYFSLCTFPASGSFPQESTEKKFITDDTVSLYFPEIELFQVPDTLVKSNIGKKRKKLLPAILAFPVPFGLFGGHRIYLGTKPYVPFVYIATLGGALALSLADFIAILRADDERFKQFQNNPKVFMWTR